MTTLILTTATRYLLPLLLLFSIFVLLRGHNQPGGGFVGGLVAASAFVLYAVAYGVARARRLLRIEPRILISLGLLTAAGSAIFSLVAGYPFMKGLWFEHEIPGIGTIGTPVVFDIGVYLVVIGVTLMIVFTLAEES